MLGGMEEGKWKVGGRGEWGRGRVVPLTQCISSPSSTADWSTRADAWCDTAHSDTAASDGRHLMHDTLTTDRMTDTDTDTDTDTHTDKGTDTDTYTGTDTADI